MSRYFAQAGDDVVVRRRSTVWQSVANIAGWVLIVLGFATTLALAFTAAQYVFAYWGMMG